MISYITITVFSYSLYFFSQSGANVFSPSKLLSIGININRGKVRDFFIFIFFSNIERILITFVQILIAIAVVAAVVIICLIIFFAFCLKRFVPRFALPPLYPTFFSGWREGKGGGGEQDNRRGKRKRDGESYAVGREGEE